MEKSCRFSYNEIDDSLLISCNEEKEKSENYLIDNIVFHLNDKGEIIGLHILNASELLNESRINPDILENINAINLNIVPKENSLFIEINIHSDKGQSKFPLGRIFMPKLV